MIAEMPFHASAQPEKDLIFAGGHGCGVTSAWCRYAHTIGVASGSPPNCLKARCSSVS